MIGLSEKSEVVGFFVFSHIQMMGYFRLGKVRVDECSAGLSPPTWARNKRKTTVKNTKKPATSDSSFDPNVSFLTRGATPLKNKTDSKSEKENVALLKLW